MNVANSEKQEINIINIFILINGTKFSPMFTKKHNLCIDSGKVAMQSFIVLCFLVSEKNVPKINIMGIRLTISP